MEIVSHGMIFLGLTFTMAGSCWEFLFGLVCFFLMPCLVPCQSRYLVMVVWKEKTDDWFLEFKNSIL